MHTKLQSLLPSLLDCEDLDAQSEALDAFYSLNDAGTFGVNDLLALIDRAMESVHQEGLRDAASDLLVFGADIAETLGADASPAVDSIARAMPALRPRARSSALLVLTLIPTEASVLTYADLIGRYASDFDDGSVPTFRPDLFNASDGACRSLFPSILQHAATRRQRINLQLMFMDFLREGLLDVSTLSGYASKFAEQLIEEVEACGEYQQELERSPPSRRYKMPYIEHRDSLGMMIDIVGLWEHESLVQIVEHIDELSDPYLRFCRAMSLLRTGRYVDSVELDWIAAHPCERVLLGKGLEELGLARRKPEACRDVAKLAEGEMALWLAFPTELGCEPDQLELMHTDVRTLKFGRAKPRPTEHYLFRYRVVEPSGQTGGRWLAGIAGGFQKLNAGKIFYSFDTFSHFVPWDECSLEEHINSFLQGDPGVE